MYRGAMSLEIQQFVETMASVCLPIGELLLQPTEKLLNMRENMVACIEDEIRYHFIDPLHW